MNDYDVILAGGGLANSLLAWRLCTHRPELRILLLDQGETLGGNHTWSFHDGDLDAAQRQWIAPLVTAHWPRYGVRFPDHARILDSGYASIASLDFHRVIAPALGAALCLRSHITEVTPTTVRLADGELLRARAVVDGRGARASAHLALGWQTFLGQEVRLREPHGLAAPVLMDASVEQQGGYRFVYLLPFGPDRLLIEDTHYVDTHELDPARLRANIAGYALARGWRIETVLREESGALPIVLAGDVERYWHDLAGQPCTGLRAGLFHPTTGYSLPHAVRVAQRVASLHDVTAPALFAALRAEALRAWHSQRFFRLLNRMLFLAGEPGQRWRVMQRFYRLPPGLIERFYAGRLTRSDMARILTGKPPVPLGQALDAALRIHPHQIRTTPA
ncbi:lycopene beta-cyclase [Pseudoduganella flava]|uniref:Lycopene beta-cyclase n=1 Tax=Pseudoduganella flava TaxID=871742 RepID=A0A562PLN1_9BURK|nr:lycopene beta-cyclase CrtY [Pseudoduganella flava]QGZ40979.1 lycopene beta-cyclase CrtY [Pseudoduganella flava]TWI45334.1 lycopene beta-cyclase [Pseudoduganella flava]